MARRRKPDFHIPVTIGVDYVVDLKLRLAEHGITNREICRHIDMTETHFSRLFRPSVDTGNAANPGIKIVIEIERAIRDILNARPDGHD